MRDRKAISSEKAYLWPNMQKSNQLKRSNMIFAHVDNIESMYSDSSTSSLSIPHRPSYQSKKHQKPHTSSTDWKRRNTNEHRGEESGYNSEVVGNTNTVLNTHSTGNPKTSLFLGNTQQATISDHFPRLEKPHKPQC